VSLQHSKLTPFWNYAKKMGATMPQGYELIDVVMTGYGYATGTMTEQWTPTESRKHQFHLKKNSQ